MAITLQAEGKRLYLLGNTYPLRDRIKALGGHWDAEKKAWWLGSGKRSEVDDLIATATSSGKEPPKADDVRLTGKCQYKGKTYFLGGASRDGTRQHLFTLPGKDGKFLDFWVDSGAIKVTKTYRPREIRHGRQTRTEYTTLGSIARFIREQEDCRERGVAVCAECGRPGDLVTDLEDGAMKHYRCCDMPSN